MLGILCLVSFPVLLGALFINKVTWYQEGDSHFSSFLLASYSGKEKKYFDFFFSLVED